MLFHRLHTHTHRTDASFLSYVAQNWFPRTPHAQLARLLELYPSDPAAGSPFGTGNDTFGVGLEYKRCAAIITDIAFQAPRRAWVQAATAAGVPTYGYLFTDQNAALQDPVLGGECAWGSGG